MRDRVPATVLSRSVSVLVAVAVVISAPRPGVAQDISARSLDIEVGGRLQTQIVHSSVAGGPGVEAVIRRARVTLDGRLNEWVDGRLQIEQGGELKDAYVRLTFDPALQVSMGKFKRAFDLFELQSSADINIERDGRVPGLDLCSGVGRVCSWSRLSEALGYSDRDVGLRVAGSPGEGWSYSATITNGTGTGGDENDAKSAAGRIVVSLAEDATLGGNVSVRDYTVAGSSEFASAWGVDLELGGFATDGFHLQSGFMGGENWEILDAEGDPATFVAAQGILSWYSSVEEAGPFVGVEPLIRLSWADPDTGADDDAGVLLTPGFWGHFGSRNKVGATVDVYRHDDLDTEWSLKLFSHLYF